MPRVSSERTTPGVDSVTDLCLKGRGYVAGRTGSGKSNAMKCLASMVDQRRAVTVCVNLHGEPVPGHGKVVSVEEIKAGLRQGRRKFDFLMPELEEVGVDVVRERVATLWRWVKATGRTRMGSESSVPPWIVVFLDEAHRYAPLNGPYGPVEAFLCEGRKFGARVVVGSQKPQQVTTEALSQADWCMVFRCKVNDAKYLASKGLPYEEFQDVVEKPFHCVVVDDNLWTPYTPWPKVD